jgi:hypothetical protein
MAHEDLHRTRHIEGSSNRAFGLVFSGLFLVIACWPLLDGDRLRWWAVGATATLAVVALGKPVLLAGPNRLWTRFGVLLGDLAGPVATAVLFYGVVTPLGIMMRLTGKDPLRLKLDPSAKTYWIQRTPPGPPPDSMTNQF